MEELSCEPDGDMKRLGVNTFQDINGIIRVLAVNHIKEKSVKRLAVSYSVRLSNRAGLALEHIENPGFREGSFIGTTRNSFLGIPIVSLV